MKPTPAQRVSELSNQALRTLGSTFSEMAEVYARQGANTPAEIVHGLVDVLDSIGIEWRGFEPIPFDAVPSELAQLLPPGLRTQLADDMVLLQRGRQDSVFGLHDAADSEESKALARSVKSILCAFPVGVTSTEDIYSMVGTLPSSARDSLVRLAERPYDFVSALVAERLKWSGNPGYQAITLDELLISARRAAGAQTKELGLTGADAERTMAELGQRLGQLCVGSGPAAEELLLRTSGEYLLRGTNGFGEAKGPFSTAFVEALRACVRTEPAVLPDLPLRGGDSVDGEGKAALMQTLQDRMRRSEFGASPVYVAGDALRDIAVKSPSQFDGALTQFLAALPDASPVGKMQSCYEFVIATARGWPEVRSAVLGSTTWRELANSQAWPPSWCRVIEAGLRDSQSA